MLDFISGMLVGIIVVSTFMFVVLKKIERDASDLMKELNSYMEVRQEMLSLYMDMADSSDKAIQEYKRVVNLQQNTIDELTRGSGIKNE